MTFKSSQILHHLIDLRQPAENGPATFQEWLHEAFLDGRLTIRRTSWEMSDKALLQGYRFLQAKQADCIENLFAFLCDELMSGCCDDARVVHLAEYFAEENAENPVYSYMRSLIERDHLDDFEQWQDEEAVARAHELAALAAKDRAA